MKSLFAWFKQIPLQIVLDGRHIYTTTVGTSFSRLLHSRGHGSKRGGGRGNFGKSDGKRITVATTLAEKFPNISLYLVKEVLFLGTPENDVPFVPGVRFSKAPESFRARKAIFRSTVSKNGEVYTPETSCIKETSLHL